MKHQAILFFYFGEHPSEEAIRNISGALLNNISCDPNTLRNINMDEDSIAKTIVSCKTEQDEVRIVSKDIKDYLAVVCEGMSQFISEEKARVSSTEELIYLLKRRYIEAFKTGCDSRYLCGVNAMYNSNDKAQCAKYVAKFTHCNINAAKVIVNNLFAIAELCHGLTEE